MIRRNFLKHAGVAGAALGTLGYSTAGWSQDNRVSAKLFNLDYAMHDGMFASHAGKDLFDQLQFAKEHGFMTLEDNDMRLRTPQRQEEIGKMISKLGMQMGVFVGHTLDWREPTLTKNDKNLNDRFLAEMREAVNIAKRCGSKYVVVVPGVISHSVDISYQKTLVLDLLRRAADILQPHKITMLLEPLNFRDHPSQLLPDVPSLYNMIKSINNPACKMCFDVYHVQIHSGNIIPNIDYAWDEIAYFQVADNPGRLEPFTGEINFNNVFRHIYKKGYRGIVGMEHSNSVAGIEGEKKTIEAYRKCDNFLD